MKEDKKESFAVFSRPDYGSARPSALAEFRHMLYIVDTDFKIEGPWVGGPKCSIADIHASWMIRIVLQTMEVEKEPGISVRDLPKVHAWINGLPMHDDNHAPDKIGATDAKEEVFGSSYAAEAPGIDPHHPNKLTAGKVALVETTDDAKPGGRAQKGKLVGLSRREIVVELEHGLRMDFPRLGFELTGFSDM